MRKYIVALSLALLACAALAEVVVFGGHHEDHFIEARGEDIDIDGHHNDVVVTGKAGVITILGHHIDLVVDDAESIVFKGHHNDVEIIDGSPEIFDEGIYNDVVASGSRPGHVIVNDGGGVQDDIDDENAQVINGAALKKVYEGQGQSFVINGAANNITIRGQVHSLNVNGSNNKVHVDEAVSISVSGYGNAVTYTRGKPDVNRSGVNVSVTKR